MSKYHSFRTYRCVNWYLTVGAPRKTRAGSLAALLFCLSVILSFCLSAFYLPDILLTFLTSLFWQLSWKVFISSISPSACLSVRLSFCSSVCVSQWLTSRRNSSSIGNPNTVFFRSISTDGCRAARPLDLVLVDWDWVTWTWTDPSPNQGEDKVCNVIYDIILFDIGFLFKISIYISNSALSDSVLSSWRTSSSASCSGR